MKREKKYKRKKVKTKRLIIFIIFLLIFITLIINILNFKIKNIYIKNNIYYTDTKIIELAGLKKYPSFLTTSTILTEMKLENNKLIKKATIKRKFWAVFEINIEEYQPYFITNQNMLILEENKMFKLNDFKDIVFNVPILTTDLKAEIFEKLKKSFKKIDKEIIKKISEIIHEPTEYIDERFLFLMTDGNHSYVTLNTIENINYYNKIVPQLEGKKGIIYFDSYRDTDTGITIEIIK